MIFYCSGVRAWVGSFCLINSFVYDCSLGVFSSSLEIKCLVALSYSGCVYQAATNSFTHTNQFIYDS